MYPRMLKVPRSVFKEVLGSTLLDALRTSEEYLKHIYRTHEPSALVKAYAPGFPAQVHLGSALELETVARLLRELDADGNGVFSLEELANAEKRVCCAEGSSVLARAKGSC